MSFITIYVGSSGTSNSIPSNGNVDAEMSSGDDAEAVNMEVDQVQQPIGGEAQAMDIGGK